MHPSDNLHGMCVYPDHVQCCLLPPQILPYLTEHFPITFEKVHPFVSIYSIYTVCLIQSTEFNS